MLFDYCGLGHTFVANVHASDSTYGTCESAAFGFDVIAFAAKSHLNASGRSEMMDANTQRSGTSFGTFQGRKNGF